MIMNLCHEREVLKHLACTVSSLSGDSISIFPILNHLVLSFLEFTGISAVIFIFHQSK